VSTRRLAQVAEALAVGVERLLADPDGVVPIRSAPSRRTPPDDDAWRDFTPLVLDAALTGALSAFLEFGYHGATMRTIAERADLSVPGLYHHYDSKQDMLVALLDVTMGDLRRRTEAALGHGCDPVERFTHVVECLALYHTHRRELAFVGASEMRSLEPAARARVAALRVSEQRTVDTTVEDGVRAGLFATTRPHEAARAVVTMCTALAQWYRHDGPAPAEHVAGLYVEFALDLVRCSPAHRPTWTVAASGRKDP
jgi:AcrR family transcriptional regulator